MHTLSKYIVCGFAFMLTVVNATPQSIAETKFADYLALMRVPQPTIVETLEPLGDNPVETVMEGFRTPETTRRQILASFLDRFRQNIAGANKNNTLLKQYSAEEQRMMQSFQVGAGNLDQEGQLASFALLMEGRPLISSGKLSWNKLSAPLTQAGQGYYQQALKIEKTLNWPVFSKEVAARDMLHNMFATDEEINGINQQQEIDKAKLPMKKVKLFEGVDATAEVQDPEKMIALLKSTEEKRQQYFQRKHGDLYRWWKVNEAIVRKCALDMDALLQATNDARNLTGNDRQLVALLADLQERIWKALMDMNGVAANITRNAQTSALSRRATAEFVETYRKMEIAQ